LDIHITTNSPRSKNSFKNKGMDIGPFLLKVDKLEKKYDYLIKLHSKNLVAFRDLCFNNIIENIYHHVLLLETNPDNYCSGPRLYLHGIDGINSYTINHFIFRNKIKLQNTEKHFFGGTMFISKYKPLKKFLNKINIKEEYELLESGMVVNNTPTNTHGWERILTYLIPNFYGMKNKFI
jgi:lipopolysaccharide biosynthesis protein